MAASSSAVLVLSLANIGIFEQNKAFEYKKVSHE